MFCNLFLEIFIFWTCFRTLKRAYEQRIRRCKKIAIKGKTNKIYIGTEDLLKIFAILIGEHVALILENAAFLFKSHRHGSVFRCFPDSLFFWRLTGNNHLNSATKRLKVKRLMPGKKYKKDIKGVLRCRRLGTPRNHFITLISLWSFTKKYRLLKAYGSGFKSPHFSMQSLKTWSLSIVNC